MRALKQLVVRENRTSRESDSELVALWHPASSFLLPASLELVVWIGELQVWLPIYPLPRHRSKAPVRGLPDVPSHQLQATPKTAGRFVGFLKLQFFSKFLWLKFPPKKMIP